MLPEQCKLTKAEELVVDVLLHPYGIEMTSTEIHKKAKGNVLAEELPALLDSLEMKGYLKGRFVLMKGYLVERRVYQLNHPELYSQSKQRLMTRVILDMMTSRISRR